VVVCFLLEPRYAGSNPAEDNVTFKGETNPKYDFLRRGSEAVGPMS
jgi:hypothetical protein